MGKITLILVLQNLETMDYLNLLSLKRFVVTLFITFGLQETSKNPTYMTTGSENVTVQIQMI